MFHRLLEANGGIPRNAEAVFCNTGKEREETLSFLKEMSERWSAPITWLEYAVDMAQPGKGERRGRNICKVVDFETASRQGEPFEALIRREGRIPSRTARFCTREMKRNTTDRYFYRKGLPPRKRTEIIGIRADESRRVHHALMEECKTDYPLVHAGVTLGDVRRYWENADFDLQMDSVFGNCDLCFLKGKGKKLRILKEDPSVADWWIQQEETSGHFLSGKGRKFQFMDGHTMREVRDAAKEASPGLFDEQDDDGISCFCGD